ncbi:MAG: response regulator [Parcubacteria group bacterium]|jgi:CheY-like chemotaxis protein
MKRAILLVDDDPDRFFIDELEELEGCEITTAETVAEALKLLYKSKFEAIILDVVIPAGEGYEEYFSLRQDTMGCPGFELARMIGEGSFGKITTIILSGLIGAPDFSWRIDRLLNDHIFAVCKSGSIDEVFKILSRIK